MRQDFAICTEGSLGVEFLATTDSDAVTLFCWVFFFNSNHEAGNE